jgi:O-antigen ligase
MGVTGTITRTPVLDEAVGSRPAAAKASKALQTQGTLVYVLLLVFTFILLARPQDYIRFLALIPIAMLVGVAAIGAYGFALFTGGLELRISTEAKLMGALTVWFVIGVPFSFWRSFSLQILTDDWLKSLVIFFLLTQTLLSLSRVRHLLWVIFMSGFAATGLSFILLGGRLDQALQNDARFMGVTQGFFGGNYLGIAAAVTLPYMAAMMLYSRSIFKVGLLFASFGTMIALVVFTASRGNIISIVISLILLWIVLLRHNWRSRILGFIFALGLAGAVALAPGAFWTRVGTLWDASSFATSSARAGARSADQSEFQRKELFWASIAYTFQHPIFGLGVGTFPIAHGSSTGNSQEWKGTHNTFTQVSSESGFPGLILFVSLLFVSLRRMWRLSRDCAPYPDLAQHRALAQATFISILAFAIGGVFAHLAYAYYLYYLAAIGVGIQNVVSIELAAIQNAPARTSNGNGIARKTFGNAARELRA